MKNKRTLNIVLIAIGIMGLAATGFFIIWEYNKAKDAIGFLKIALIGFVPFVLSYVLTRKGIKRMILEKR